MIFVSYLRANIKKVREILAQLKSTGFDNELWFAADDYAPSSKVHEVLKRKIADANSVLLFESQATKRIEARSLNDNGPFSSSEELYLYEKRELEDQKKKVVYASVSRLPKSDNSRVDLSMAKSSQRFKTQVAKLAEAIRGD